MYFQGILDNETSIVYDLVKTCFADAPSKVYLASLEGMEQDTIYEFTASADINVSIITAAEDSTASLPVLCSRNQALASEGGMVLKNESNKDNVSELVCSDDRTRKVINFDDLGELGDNKDILYPPLGDYQGLKWRNMYGIRADEYILDWVFRGNAISQPWAVLSAWTRSGDTAVGVISSEKPFDLLSA